MGLFNRKKRKVEQSKKDKAYEIVCLYCFRNFSHDKTLFRALDSLDEEGYRAQRDKQLDAYREKFHMDSIGELPVILDPTEFSEVSKGYHRGILSSLKDAYDNVTTKRICPFCHNDLPKSAGFAPSTIISFVGASQVGKSVYLTSLIHALKTVTPRNFQIFCTPISNEMSKKFKYEYEDPLIENGYLLDPTQKEKQQEPFIFTFSFADSTKPEINIAFFDVAGEGMIDNEYLEIYAAHIRNSSGILFLVDPLQFKSVGRKILLKNNLDYDLAHAEDPIDVLSGLVEDYIYKQSNSVSQIPTVMVLTKTDLLEALRNDGEYIRDNSNIFKDYIHKGFLNLTEFENIDGEVDEFIEAVDPNFRNALKRRFARLGFFAVSALGAHPDVIRQRVAAFAPVRVDEPFLWILYKLGYIEGRKP
jgi:GTPase SAR1 family protein